MNLFDIIGYTGEVSEPNGPAVKGYFLMRWGDEANRKFNAWLARHDEIFNDHIAAAETEIDRLASDAALIDVETRLSSLLSRLTGGRLSKPSYPVDVMVAEIENYFEEQTNEQIAAALEAAEDQA